MIANDLVIVLAIKCLILKGLILKQLKHNAPAFYIINCDLSTDPEEKKNS